VGNILLFGFDPLVHFAFSFYISVLGVCTKLVDEEVARASTGMHAHS
jgi:hypothetical protein